MTGETSSEPRTTLEGFRLWIGSPIEECRPIAVIVWPIAHTPSFSASATNAVLIDCSVILVRVTRPTDPGSSLPTCHGGPGSQSSAKSLL